MLVLRPTPFVKRIRKDAFTAKRHNFSLLSDQDIQLGHTTVTNRITRIYTRTGDNGETGLADGSRVGKDELRLDAIGTLDELNSHLGMILAHELPSATRQLLIRIQHDLFDAGAELAHAQQCALREAHVLDIEHHIDQINADLPPLREFVLPSGGSAALAACHIARTVCRRTERLCVALNRHETLNPHLLHYLNRLSDALFVIARALAKHEGAQETLWEPHRRFSDKHPDQST
jgi:cob(I)alamin adenosyltransferase